MDLRKLLQGNNTFGTAVRPQATPPASTSQFRQVQRADKGFDFFKGNNKITIEDFTRGTGANGSNLRQSLARQGDQVSQNMIAEQKAYENNPTVKGYNLLNVDQQRIKLADIQGLANRKDFNTVNDLNNQQWAQQQLLALQKAGNAKKGNLLTFGQDLVGGFIAPAQQIGNTIGDSLNQATRGNKLQNLFNLNEINSDQYKAGLDAVLQNSVDTKATQDAQGNVGTERKTPLEFAQKFGAEGANAGVTYLPIGAAYGNVAKLGLKPAAGLVAGNIAKEGTAYTVANTVNDALQGRQITPESIAMNAALSFGGAGVGASTALIRPGVAQAARTTTKLVKDTGRAIEQVNPQIAQIDETLGNYKRAYDVETNPVLREQINRGITQLNTERRNMLQRGSVPASNFDPTGKLGNVDPTLPTAPKTEVPTRAETRVAKALDPNDPLKYGQLVPKEQALFKATKSTTRKVQPQVKTQEPLTQSSTKSLDNVSSTNLNTKRLDLTDEATARLNKETSVVVERLTNEEVKGIAKSAGIDFSSHGVSGTKKKITEQLNLRNEITTIESKIVKARAAGKSNEVIALMNQSAELGRISRSQGTDLGRQLQARRIIADQLATPQQKLYRLLDEAGVNQDVYIKRLADVDMMNAKEVTKAYRDLVPANFGDWLDKYRYSNMLSSPLTHMVNISSNLTGIAGIAPVEKLFAGVVDATRSAVTGKARTRFASEAGSYYKGVAKSVPEALKRFKDVMTGKQSIDMPDVDSLKYGKLADGGIRGAADTVLSVIPKLLEASDQFGMTLTKGGEMASLLKRQSKGVKLTGDIAGKVDDAAKYRVFRQDLGKEGQGTFLDVLDFIPQMLMQGRNSKNVVVSTISKFTIPFITTPTNLLKQGIEYSPLGILTLSKHADKTGQVAKMAMGTTLTAVAVAALASKDAITFNEPSNAEQRNAFRAEGKQPYAIKIGDKWYNYSKLHPAISFNLAVVGAVKDAQDKGSVDQPTADKILNMAGGVIGYFRDQSYMKSIGDFTANLELKDGAQLEDAFASVASNYANQLSPFKSMVSWIGRQVDPTQRKTDYTKGALEQIYQNIIKDIPGLNKDVPVRQNPYTGEAIKNDNPLLNAFSPIRVTNDRGYGNTTGLNIDQRMVNSVLPQDQRDVFRQDVIDKKYATSQDNKTKAELALKELTLNSNQTVGKETESNQSEPNITELKSGKFYAKVGEEFKTFDTKAEAKIGIIKDAFDKSGKNYQVEGDTVLRRSADGTISSTPKIKYDYDVGTATLEQQKQADNLDGWMITAQGQIDSIEKQLTDPSIDPLDKIKLENDRQTIIDNATKYNGYGGFTKAKGSKKGKGSGSGKGSKSDYASLISATNKTAFANQQALQKLIKGKKITRRKIA